MTPTSTQIGTPRDGALNATVNVILDPAVETALTTATARLASDPEIQAEVRAELAAHLTEAIAAHRTAGTPNPTAAALADLGNPETLATDLLAANQKRLHRRKLAVVGGTLAIPVTFLAGLSGAKAALLALLTLVSVLAAGFTGQGTYFPASWSWQRSFAARSYAGRLDAETRELLGQGELPFAERQLASAKAFVAHSASHPETTAAAAIRLAESTLLAAREPAPRSLPSTLAPPPKEGDIQSAISAARAADPDNGYVDLLESDWLFKRSLADGPQDGARRMLMYQSRSLNPALEEVATKIVKDPAGFARSLELIHIAAGKREITNRLSVLFAPIVAALPTPRSAIERAERSGILSNLPVYPRGFNSWDIAWAAQDLALRGDRAAASQLAVDQRAIGLKMVHSAEQEDVLRVGTYNIRLADEVQCGIALQAGETERARTIASRMAARDESVRLSPLWSDFSQAAYDQISRRAGVLESERLYGLNATDAAFTASRASEYAMADHAVFTFAALITLALAATFAARRFSASRQRARLPVPGDSRAPIALWPSFASVLRLLAAAAAPGIAYFLLANLTPLLGRQTSLGLSLSRVTVQYAAVFALSLTAIALTMRPLLAERGAALGLRASRPKLLGIGTLGGLLLVGLICGEATNWGLSSSTLARGGHRALSINPLALALACGFLVYGLATAIRLGRVTADRDSSPARWRRQWLAVLLVVTVVSIATLLNLPRDWSTGTRWLAILIAGGCWAWTLQKARPVTPAKVEPTVAIGGWWAMGLLALGCGILSMSGLAVLRETHHAGLNPSTPSVVSSSDRAATIAAYGPDPLEAH